MKNGFFASSNNNNVQLETLYVMNLLFLETVPDRKPEPM